jgi:hypothetical protein
MFKTQMIGLSALLSIDAVLFSLGALAHAGVPIPLVVGTWKEPVVVGAMIVEGAGATLLIITLISTSVGWWNGPGLIRITLWYCFIGVLWGMAMLALGRVPAARTVTNDFLHIGMLLMTTVALVITK